MSKRKRPKQPQRPQQPKVPELDPETGLPPVRKQQPDRAERLRKARAKHVRRG